MLISIQVNIKELSLLEYFPKKNEVFIGIEYIEV